MPADAELARGGLTSNWRIAAAALILLVYFGIPNARPDFTRFNSNDSECYVALGWNLAHGRGYTRSFVDGQYVAHKTWPPATPLLMVPAALVSSSTINWHAAKLTMAAVGVIGIVLTWIYLATVTGRRLTADLGAFALAFSPLYWDFSHQVMAEVPLTVCCIGTLILVHLAWTRPGNRTWLLVSAGLLGGVGMLFKGHGGGLLFAPLPYLLLRREGGSLSPRSAWGAYLLFAVSLSVLPGAWALRNAGVSARRFESINQFRSLVVKDPNEWDSPVLEPRELGARALQTLRLYGIYRPAEQLVPGLWFGPALAWRNSGWLALVISGFFLMAAFVGPGSIPAPAWAAAPMMMLSLTHGLGGAERYWVPSNSLLLLSLIASAVTVIKPRTRAITVALLVLLLNGGAYIWQHERAPYNPSNSPTPWEALAQLFEKVGEHQTLDVRNVYTQNGNAFSLMTGHPASFNNALEPDALYDYAVFDLRYQSVPAGSERIVTAQPLTFARLAEPLTAAQLQTTDSGR